MYSWVRFSHLVQWSQGQLQSASSAEFPIPGISTDTRAIKRGEVFAAVPGDKFDGHDYVKDAIAQGASAVIAERVVPSSVPLILVDKVVAALSRIATQLRVHFTGPVVAVTGSAGKSSTKDAIATLLGPGTVKSPASFNNLLGVSKTVFLVEDATRYLVLEMGMNAFGEIKELCDHFQPKAGLITNIGDAHIGKLGGKEGIYRAKKELFDHLAATQNLIGVGVNIDDPMVVKAFEQTFAKSARAVRYSGQGKSADVSVLHREIDPETGFLSLGLRVRGSDWAYELPVFGLHHCENVVAAISAALLLGIEPSVLKERVRDIRPASHRGEISVLKDGVTLIDESYNANPTAMCSSLESLTHLASHRSRLLILGEMRELGEFSASLHEKVGSFLAEGFASLPFRLMAVGRECEHLIRGVKSKAPNSDCSYFADVSALKPALSKAIRPGDVVFVKGSRGVQLDKAVEMLKSGTV